MKKPIPQGVGFFYWYLEPRPSFPIPSQAQNDISPARKVPHIEPVKASRLLNPKKIPLELYLKSVRKNKR